MNLEEIKLQYFKQNKYSKWYFSIVENAKGRPYSKDLYEQHHVVPDSFFKDRSRPGPKGIIEGNPNEVGNLVNLTIREHYICHLLLVKALNHKHLQIKAVFAMQMMQTRGNIVNSRLYEMGKSLANQAKSEMYDESIRPSIEDFWKDTVRVKEAATKRKRTLENRTPEEKQAKKDLARSQAAKNFFTPNAKENRKTNIAEINAREDQSWKWPEKRREKYRNGEVTRYKNEKEWFLSPEGEAILVEGITKFAKQNQLDAEQMRNLIRKPHKHHSCKGWTYLGPFDGCLRPGKKK